MFLPHVAQFLPLSNPLGMGAGVGGVASVRQGKVFDIEIEGADRAKAEAALKNAAEKLLANTVIENYRVEVTG